MLAAMLIPAMLNAEPDFAAWGRDALGTIESRYKAGATYTEVADGKDAVYLWGLSVTLSAYAAAGRVDRDLGRKGFEACLQQLARYAGPSGKGSDGFDASTGAGGRDRYYDDNAWLGLALLDGAEWLGRPEYLTRAQEVYRYVLSGEDVQLGGGIYWRENPKDGKNTCANAPAALLAYRLYRATQEERYLKDGDRLMAWLLRLQAPDGLYWDNQNLNGMVEKTLWSYNAALPIRARLERFAALREAKDLAEARRIAKSAAARWIDPRSGAIRDEASFAHHLCETFLAFHEPDWDSKARHALVALHRSSKNGLYGKRWDAGPEGRTQLLFQASAARAFFMAAKSVQ